MDCQGTSCIPLSQSELIPAPAPVSWPAQRLLPQQRQELAIRALAGAETISELARQHEVSRKFVYQQVAAAEVALDRAFAPPPRADDVLFYLPVTKAWLRQLVLALVLICHSSFRGVIELLRDLFDYRSPVGTVHNIVHARRRLAPGGSTGGTTCPGSASACSTRSSRPGDPVLVGVDAASTYCFLLSQEEHRDADTWGIRLLELADRGFAPEATVADFASGLRAGHEQALPGVPCRGDVFHALYDLGPLVRYLENRAYEAIDGPDQARAQAGRRRTAAGPEGSVPGRQKLRSARRAEAEAIALADDVALLARWLRDDILSVAGPESAIRRELFDFVVAELRAREPACPHRIRPVRHLLENQRERPPGLRRGAGPRPGGPGPASGRSAVTTAREVLQVQALPMWDPQRWRREAALRATLKGRYHGVCAEVEEAVRSGRAGQQPGREPQQSAADLLLPAAAAGGRLLGVAPVLPEPPPIPPQRATPAGWARAPRS